MARHHLPPGSGGGTKRRCPARSNPLWRTSDRIQWWAARLLLILVVIGLPAVSVGVGTLVNRSEMRTAQAQAAERHPVTARLVKDAPAADGSVSGVDVAAKVRWTASDGTRHTGTAMVDAGTRSGSSVRIWVDSSGKVTKEPLTSTKAAAGGWMAGVLTAELVLVLSLAGWKGIVGVLDRGRYAQWDAEWAKVEPEWSGKLRG